MFRALLTRFQYKSKLFSFPINFEGLTVDEQILQSRYLPMHQRCRATIVKIFEEDLADGFKFAFQNVLAALETKDLNFMELVCEPSLFRELEKSMGVLDGRNLCIKSDYNNDPDLNLKYTSFSFICGVAHDRRLNKKKELYESSQLWNLKNGTDLRVFKPQFDAKLYWPFIRVSCLFSCPSGIYLKNTNGKVISGLTSTNYHKLTFEGIRESPDENDLDNIVQAQKDVWKVMSNSESEEKLRLIRRIFRVDDIIWKVVDIDNHMNGNPYVL